MSTAPWWRTPLRVSLPWSADGAPSARNQVAVPVGRLQRAARVSAVVIPWVMVVLGTTLAVVSGLVLERDLGDAAGGIGIELGSALWFGGLLTLGARRGATVGRALALAGLALAGVALVVVAVRLGWSGAALDLALEFGVGAVAVAAIDVVLLGTLHSRLARLGDAEEQVVTLAFGGEPPWLSVRSSRAGDAGA
jgi:hypothetical protein